MNFTVVGTPEAEARVQADLDRIVGAVREADPDGRLQAIVLLGGFARGEGAVTEGPDGKLRGFNDYDLLLVFDETPSDRDRFSRLGAALAEELGIDFVDLGVVAHRQIEHMPPTLFGYEIGEAHRVLWSRSPVRFPRFDVRAIDPAEGTRLLVNRGMALLWAGDRLWPGRAPDRTVPEADPDDLRFATVAAHKAVLAAGDAALLREGTYSISQTEREARLATSDLGWADSGFLDAYRTAAAYRRAPRPLEAGAVGPLWHEARRHHEVGLRAAESARTGRPVDTWPGHRRRLQVAAVHPANLLQGLRRRVRGDEPLPEQRWLPEMTRLLYDDGVPERSTRLKSLVEAWHP